MFCFVMKKTQTERCCVDVIAQVASSSSSSFSKSPEENPRRREKKKKSKEKENNKNKQKKEKKEKEEEENTIKATTTVHNVDHLTPSLFFVCLSVVVFTKNNRGTSR